MAASRPSIDELDRLVAELRRIENIRVRVQPGAPALAELDEAEADVRARLREVTRVLELRRTRLELETELASLEDEYRRVAGEEPDFPERAGNRGEPGRAAGNLAAGVRAVEDPYSPATLEGRIRRVRLRLARLSNEGRE